MKRRREEMNESEREREGDNVPIASGASPVVASQSTGRRAFVCHSLIWGLSPAAHGDVAETLIRRA